MHARRFAPIALRSICRRALLGGLLAAAGCSSGSTPAGDGPRLDRGARDRGPGTSDAPVMPGRDIVPAADGARDAGLPDDARAADSAVDGGGPDGPLVGVCACAVDEVCTTGDQCIKTPQPQPGEVIAELRLLQQISPPVTTLIDALGKAEATFYAFETLPGDARQSFMTPDGEKCFYEKSTNYPYYYDGKSWPAGRRLGAGQLTFEIVGAPGPVQLEPYNSSHPAGGDSWGYLHDDVPPPLTDGTSTLVDMFDIGYVPLGSTFQVKLAGGPDLGAQTLGRGRIANAFSVLAPDIEHGTGQISSSQPLTVSWSPAQPSARMEIFVTVAIGIQGDYGLLSCDVADDGETVIPAQAMQAVASGSTIGVQLRRTALTYLTATSLAGQPVHVRLMGRHARLRSFARVP